MSRSAGVYFETKIFDSKAYKSLTKAQQNIYFEFLLKRQFGKSSKKNRDSTITNNGKIVFTFTEAVKMGYTRQTFGTGVRKLISVGLVDLKQQGFGGVIIGKRITGEANLYAVSDRWKQYGTDAFKDEPYPKDSRNGRGWAVFNRLKKRQ